MAEKRYSNVIGFDDSPFAKDHMGSVKVVGTVFAAQRFDGVLITDVEKDGSDSAETINRVICRSRFKDHIQLLMLQGITLAGFNVVDARYLQQQLQIPVLVVSRKLPDLTSIRTALLDNIADGARKWALINSLGPMQPMCGLYVQRVGISETAAAATIRQFAMHGKVPEPIRLAHMIAGALVEGESHGTA
jgi:endonuclease V-like protein UPF0215 family